MSFETRSLPTPDNSKISPNRIDFSITGSNEERVELFLNTLRTSNRYQPGNLYTGVDGERLDAFETEGATFSPDGTIYCSTETQLFESCDSLNNAMGYADHYDVPAMVVYEGNKLTLAVNGSNNEYVFIPGIKPQEALVGIFIFEY